MPIDTQESVNSISKSITSLPIVRTIIQNPIWTAVAIIAIMILMTIFVFRNVETPEGESVTKLSLRAGAYGLLFVIGVVFLHNQYLMNEQHQENKTGAMENIFDSVDTAGRGNPTFSSQLVPVMVNLPSA
jgi:hypothetical protein